MKAGSVAFFVLIALFTAVYACRQPDNHFDIFFTDNETVNLSPIEEIGEEGINYYREEYNAGMFSITFRSHYNPAVMVQLNQGGIGFVVDTSVLQIESFPFDSCVRVELDWLVDVGVLSIDLIQRQNIERKFSGGNAGGCIFWTRQNTLLPSSTIYDDEGNLVQIDCASGPIAINLPPQMLYRSTGIRDDFGGIKRTRKFIIRGSKSAVIYDIRGRNIGSAFKVHGVPSGMVIRYDPKTEAIKSTLNIRK